MKTILNVETGEEIIRELNADELAQEVIDAALIAEKEAVKAEIATQRQALLNRLGITADEAKLLLS